MADDSQLVETIKAIVGLRIDGGSEGWCWETVLAEAVRYEWDVFDDDAPQQVVVGPSWTEHFKGTGSEAWDQVIRQAGERVREYEGPYNQYKYAGDQRRRELARTMARFLEQEVKKAGLEPPNRS